MGSFSMVHWVIVLIVVLLLFGAGRVSDIGKGLGEGIRNFKKGLKEDDDVPVADKTAAEPEKSDAKASSPKQLTTGKKKVVEVEIGDDDDEAEIARKIAAKRRATKGADDESA
jgi:sec-independent protein translocase protein TatA